VRRSAAPKAADRASQVYDKLRELIVRGRLAPGARITETDVAERLGVSRTPVRAALQRLAQEGYVVAPNAGHRHRATVAPLTREDATELLHIVAEIEGLAARYAAALNPKRRTELVQAMRQLNDELRRAAEQAHTDANAMFEWDQSLHRLLVEAAAGSRLLALHEAIKPQAERYGRVYYGAVTDAMLASVEEHALLLRAIETGDSDAAQRAVLTNWRSAATRLGEVIDRMGERGSW